MPKFLGCIADGAAAADATDDEKAALAQAAAVYHEAFASAADALGPEEADRAAGKAAMDALEAQALRKRQLQAMAIRARRARLEDAARFKEARGYSDVKPLGGGGGKAPPKGGDGGGWYQGGAPPPKGPNASGGVMADWLKELIDGEGGLAGGSGPSVKGRYEAVSGHFQAMMADLLDKFEDVTGTGIRGRAQLTNIVREAFGHDTGDAAAQALAKTWAETAERARQMFNAAGGDVGKLEAWGLPQAHDGLAVRHMGRETWVDYIAPLLNPAKMPDRITNLPMSDKRLRAVLGEVWDNIASAGAASRETGEHLGIGALANRRADERFLVFKDADSWLAYQQRLGTADPYVAMMRHLDGMARDIAQLQVLGPNPTHQFEWLARAAQREAQLEQIGGAKAQTWLKQAEGDVDSARKMYGLFRGELARPYGADNWIARVGTAVRAGLSAVQLGSAVINDVASNPVYAAQVRAFAGLEQRGGVRPWLEHVANTQTRQSARRLGFIIESARVRHADAVQRFLRAQTVGGKIAEGANAFAHLLPAWVNRASFLDANRAASRFAFQHEFMGRLVELSDKGLADLAGSADASARAFGEILQARGFSPAEWDQVRSTTPEEPAAGATFISPMAVGRAHGDELGFKVAEMIEREARQAFPEASLWAQAQLLGSTRPGTIQGELMRSLAAYRSFTLTQTYRWAREFMVRGADQAEASGAPWQLKTAMLAAPLFIGATLTGALAMWAKDIAKGNDPRPMLAPDNAEKPWKRPAAFWGQAMLQGGGQGILGDFLTSLQSRAGKSTAMTALGAPAGLVSDLWDVSGGEVGKAIDGQPLHLGRDATNLLRRYSPLSSLWWARAAWDRAVADQVQKLVDPDARASFAARAQRIKAAQGQDQWWPSGQALPARAPSFTAQR